MKVRPVCDSLQHSGQETTLNRQQRTENLETPSNLQQSAVVLLQAPPCDCYCLISFRGTLPKVEQQSAETWQSIKEQAGYHKQLVEKMTSLNVTYGKDFLPLPSS